MTEKKRGTATSPCHSELLQRRISTDAPAAGSALREGPGPCVVEGDFQQLALGPDRFQCGFAGLFEFALHPWCDSFDQFFWRVVCADQAARDSECECDFLDSVRAFQA